MLLRTRLYQIYYHPDPFYTPPPGFENAPLGQILRSRQLPHLSLEVYTASQNIKSVYQFLYRTTDAFNQSTSTVGTVIVPYNADNSKLISYQVMQNTLSTNCTFSYAIHVPHNYKLITGQLEMLALDSLFQRGYYVFIPDHWGTSGYFGSAVMAGQATLDGIRATLSSGNLTQLRPDANVQLWGYSSGSFATCAAAQLQPTYAPDLQNSIIGISMGGIPVNINATFANSSKTVFSELSLLGINSYMLMDKEFGAYIDSILRPEMKDEFYQVRRVCFAELAYYYAYKDLSTYFTRSDYANHPAVERVLKANTLGQGTTPTVPIFIYHATNDEVTPFYYVNQMYSRWCSNGANIEMAQDDTGRHVNFFFFGLAGLLQNLERRFEDPYFHSGCSIRRSKYMILDRGAISTTLKALLDAAHGILGLPLGLKETDSGKWKWLSSLLG